MKAQATLKNVHSENCKNVIVRNLSRILDIRIIDYDVDSGILYFLYHGQKAFEQVKNELNRIGHPILNYTAGRNGIPNSTSSDHASIFSRRSRKPHMTIDR